MTIIFIAAFLAATIFIVGILLVGLIFLVRLLSLPGFLLLVAALVALVEWIGRGQ